MGWGDGYPSKRSIDRRYDVRETKMEELPKTFTGTLKVGRWSGHGEGGTVAEVTIKTPNNWMYDLPEDIKRQIGEGIEVEVILKPKVKNEKNN